MKKWILISAIIFLASCSVKTIPVTVPLSLPPALELPTLQTGALECLSGDAYQTLVTRDKLLKARVSTLENIIRSTH